MAIQIIYDKDGNPRAFQAQLKSRGQKSASATFDTFEAAEEYERNGKKAIRAARGDAETRRANGRDIKSPGAVAFAAMRVAQIADDFAKAQPDHKDAIYVDNIKKFVGDVRVCQLDEQWTKKFCERLRKIKAGRRHNCYREGTIGNYIAYSRGMCNWKARSLGIAKPALGLTKKFLEPGWDDGRERRLRGDEEQRIREELGMLGAKKFRKKGSAPGARGKPWASARHYQLLFDFAIQTCARETEMVDLPWREVDLEGRVWLLPAKRSKSKTRRKIYLTPKALEILNELHLDKDPSDCRAFHRLPSSRGCSRAFHNVVARLGIEDLVFHDLRHEGISVHRMAKTFEPDLLMRMVGHSSPAMAMLYFNPLDSEVFAGMERALIGGHLADSSQESAIAAAETRLVGKLEGLLSLLAANALDLGLDPALAQARLGERVRELLAPAAKEPLRL